MTTFIFVALALGVAVTALVTVPLLRRTEASSGPAKGAALAAAAVLVIGSAALYVMLSNWSWSTKSTADTPQAMVARLARRLERNPRDLEGWLMLGRSYAALGQPRLAIRAYQRADQLSEGKNVEALIGMSEALTMEDESALEGRAGQLIEKALALEPRSGQALFYGAMVAIRRGDLPLARERLTAMLELNPPESIRSILDRQIAAIDAQMGAAETRQAGSPAPLVRVNVTLSAALDRGLPSDAPLFVIVRDPGRPGPPLAVKRLPSRFPQTIELTAADAMMAGESALTPGREVQVVARIARSGGPQAQSGDPFGEVRYRLGRDGLVDIVIDRLMP